MWYVLSSHPNFFQLRNDSRVFYKTDKTYLLLEWLCGSIVKERNITSATLPSPFRDDDGGEGRWCAGAHLTARGQEGEGFGLGGHQSFLLFPMGTLEA